MVLLKELEEAEYPIFEWPDVLLQESVPVFAHKNNATPLPGHQHSVGIKFFVFSMIVLVVYASVSDPNSVAIAFTHLNVPRTFTLRGRSLI